MSSPNPLAMTKWIMDKRGRERLLEKLKTPAKKDYGQARMTILF